MAPTTATATLVRGTTVELFATMHGEEDTGQLTARAVHPWRPLITPPPAGGNNLWRYQGEPGDAVILLAGKTLCCLGLGAEVVIGELHVTRPRRLLPGAAPVARFRRRRAVQLGLTGWF